MFCHAYLDTRYPHTILWSTKAPNKLVGLGVPELWSSTSTSSTSTPKQCHFSSPCLFTCIFHAQLTWAIWISLLHKIRPDTILFFHKQQRPLIISKIAHLWVGIICVTIHRSHVQIFFIIQVIVQPHVTLHLISSEVYSNHLWTLRPLVCLHRDAMNCRLLCQLAPWNQSRV